MRGNNCSRCIYVDSPCVPSDYGRDEHNNCDHYKSVFNENKEIYKKMADLDTALEDCTESLTDARIKIKELEKENLYYKDIIDTNDAEWEEQGQRVVELEKENAKLQAKIDDWQSEYIELENFKNNEIAELKKQIEKMKCCQNCRKFNNLSYDCTCAEVCNEWELRR